MTTSETLNFSKSSKSLTEISDVEHLKRGATSENTFVGAEIHSESCFSIETSLETMQKAENFRLRRSKGQNTNKMY